ncbi:MAG: hypothetical protein LUQ50_00670 [Methanospirillum sp.]|uniref:hypothetical protein n=1 Tax=Methanospirillum sp. TaxID=45200 RepID=UPI00236D40F8|nr:hypothetical protein [Methanospirillum sp.]MDD1727565.1 hypothetical protein [Methanospirillum sp.]
MTDPTTAGFLIILLILLTVIWTYPLFRVEIKRDIRFLAIKACVHITAALVLFGLAVTNWNFDVFQMLRLVAGFFLLYEGTITILNIYADMRRSPIRERGT